MSDAFEATEVGVIDSGTSEETVGFIPTLCADLICTLISVLFFWVGFGMMPLTVIGPGLGTALCDSIVRFLSGIPVMGVVLALLFCMLCFIVPFVMGGFMLALGVGFGLHGETKFTSVVCYVQIAVAVLLILGSLISELSYGPESISKWGTKYSTETYVSEYAFEVEPTDGGSEYLVRYSDEDQTYTVTVSEADYLNHLVDASVLAIQKETVDFYVNDAVWCLWGFNADFEDCYKYSFDFVYFPWDDVEVERQGDLEGAYANLLWSDIVEDDCQPPEDAVLWANRPVLQ